LARSSIEMRGCDLLRLADNLAGGILLNKYDNNQPLHRPVLRLRPGCRTSPHSARPRRPSRPKNRIRNRRRPRPLLCRFHYHRLHRRPGLRSQHQRPHRLRLAQRSQAGPPGRKQCRWQSPLHRTPRQNQTRPLFPRLRGQSRRLNLPRPRQDLQSRPNHRSADQVSVMLQPRSNFADSRPRRSGRAKLGLPPLP
jgi:hypothetical protein